MKKLVKKRLKDPAAIARGALGGKAAQSGMSHAKRRELGQKGAAARNKSLSAKRRREIALLAVAERERRRRERGRS
jgi:hypothetical protein